MVCLNKRRDLENKGYTFEEHVENDHNVFRYVEYLLFLKAKNPNKFNGIEYFVYQCLQNKTIYFLPRE